MGNEEWNRDRNHLIKVAVDSFDLLEDKSVLSMEDCWVFDGFFRWVGGMYVAVPIRDDCGFSLY